MGPLVDTLPKMDNMFDDPAEDEKYAQRPDSLKKLRACKTCKLIKTRDQFYSSFCDNCLHSRPQETPNQNMREDFVEQETTADFEGYGLRRPPSFI